MNRFLHIVCLDTPWPPDYGGAIDMMNRIIALKKLGIGIHLHYFSYNERGTPNELNQFCETIRVYERKRGTAGLSLTQPYIIASRINEQLAADLEKDDYPVLLEGIHCTGVLQYLNISQRRIVVRMHNEESVYYDELARSEKSFFKKLFFLNESRRLKKYSRQLPTGCTYACVSAVDASAFSNHYHLPETRVLPIFPSWQKVNGEEGAGNLCLYQGNLSVAENEKAAIWLLRNVFCKIKIPFVIAGKKPSRSLVKQAHLCQHTCLVADPSESEMNDLIHKAHIHVLPAFNKRVTGTRLKLLHALFEGRHCVVNPPMVEGTGLQDACHVGTTAGAIASIITQLYHKPFTDEEIKLRRRLLEPVFNNDKNAEQLTQWLW